MDDKNQYMPQTKEELEAYFRAMDEANDAIVQNAEKNEKASKD